MNWTDIEDLLWSIAGFLSVFGAIAIAVSEQSESEAHSERPTAPREGMWCPRDECGVYFVEPVPVEQRFHFCPYCGADLDREASDFEGDE